MNKTIIFSAGGTGGHIFPAINLMKHFFDKGYRVLLVTDHRGKQFIEENLKFEIYVLKMGTTTNKNFIRKFFSIFVIFYSIIKSIYILRKEKPHLVFGFGGYVSFPISFASKFFKLPLIIYENNIFMGRANKFLSKFSKKIFFSKKVSINFPKKYKNKTCLVGPILNKKFINFLNFEKNKTKNHFSILILGGSQGAEIFGAVVPQSIKMLKEKGINITINQQCTKGQKDKIKNFYDKNNIKNYTFEFSNNILELISSSDLAITRCGASTTAELAHALTPFIAVPLPNSIDDHQYLNAKYYQDNGSCFLLTQNNFNSNNLFKLIYDIYENKEKLKEIRENMKKIYSNNVYNNIEKQIEDYI